MDTRLRFDDKPVTIEVSSGVQASEHALSVDLTDVPIK
jgi:hypothetical protein